MIYQTASVQLESINKSLLCGAYKRFYFMGDKTFTTVTLNSEMQLKTGAKRTRCSTCRDIKTFYCTLSTAWLQHHFLLLAIKNTELMTVTMMWRCSQVQGMWSSLWAWNLCFQRKRAQLICIEQDSHWADYWPIKGMGTENPLTVMHQTTWKA